jgi:hypothetical protein
MIARAVTIPWNLPGAVMMIVGWFLVIAGQGRALVGFGLVGLVAIGSLDVPRDSSARAGTFGWQGRWPSWAGCSSNT